MASKRKSPQKASQIDLGISSKKFLGIIAIRSGSKRFKDKNLAMYGKENLTERAIRVLSPYCEEIALSTDYPQEKVGDIGKAVYLQRPWTLNGDDVPYQYVVKWTWSMYFRNTEWDAIIALMVTNPRIGESELGFAVKAWNNGNFDILRGYNAFDMSENGFYMMKPDVLTDKKIFDVYTGAMFLPGKEIHTEKELKAEIKHARKYGLLDS